MTHYDTLKQTLTDEMLAEDAHTLIMSSGTYSKLLLDKDFASKVIDGSNVSPPCRFVWFELDGHGSFVFPIEFDDALPLGSVNARRDAGEKPSIHFP